MTRFHQDRNSDTRTQPTTMTDGRILYKEHNELTSTGFNKVTA